MKKLLTSIVAVVLLLTVPFLQSCSKDPIKIGLKFTNLNFTIPAGDKYQTATVTIKKSDWQKFITDAGQTFDFNKVKKLDFKSFKLSVDGSKVLNEFDFADLKFAKTNNTSEEKIAYISTIADGSKEVSFSSNYFDAKSYLAEDEFLAKVVIFRNYPGVAYTFTGDLELEVEYSQK